MYQVLTQPDIWAQHCVSLGKVCVCVCACACVCVFVLSSQAVFGWIKGSNRGWIRRVRDLKHAKPVLAAADNLRQPLFWFRKRVVGGVRHSVEREQKKLVTFLWTRIKVCFLCTSPPVLFPGPLWHQHRRLSLSLHFGAGSIFSSSGSHDSLTNQCSFSKSALNQFEWSSCD